MELDYRQKLNLINNRLSGITVNESSLIQIESLFYDVMSILRSKEEDPEFARLIYEMNLIKDNEYKLTQHNGLKSKRNIAAIKSYKSALKLVLNKAIKLSGKKVM